MKFSAVIFDLDGTLLDTAGDVVGMMRQVVASHGLPVDGVRSDVVVGPPLHVGMSRACPQADADLIDRMVTEYRDRYFASDYPETRVYPGIPELLAGLAVEGTALFVATNKASVPTGRILRRFELFPLFTMALSADHNPGSSMSKAQMIRFLLESHHLDSSTTLMVGDTELDINGGREAGVHTLAALYGYGKHETLYAARPDFITRKPDWRLCLEPNPQSA